MEKSKEIKKVANKPNGLIHELNGSTNYVIDLIGEQFKNIDNFYKFILFVYNNNNWENEINFNESYYGILWINYSITIDFKIDFIKEKYEIYKREYQHYHDSMSNLKWVATRLLNLNALRIIMSFLYNQLDEKTFILLLSKTCLRYELLKKKRK